MLELLEEGQFFEELPRISKKLVLVLAIFVPVTDGGEKIVKVSCIHNLVWFQESQRQKGQEQIKALLDSGSKVNAMSCAFARKLGLHIWKTNVGAQKINGFTLETFEIVIADFWIEDKGSRLKFFQKTFLVTDAKFEVILKMPFLKISNADVAFGKKILTWKSYTTHKALPTTKQI